MPRGFWVAVMCCTGCGAAPGLGGPADAAVDADGGEMRPAIDGGETQPTTDNCPLDPSPNWSDSDHDGKGDVCDPCPDDALDACDSATRWRALRVKGLSSCALTEAGELRCLGDFAVPEQLAPDRFTELSMDWSTGVCGLREDGELLCFDRKGVVRNPLHAAVHLESGEDLTCAIDTGGLVSCWSPVGALTLGGAVQPQPSFESFHVGSGTVCAAAANHTLRCRETDAFGAPAEQLVTAADPWTQYLVLNHAVCFLGTTGTVSCTQLANPLNAPASLDVAGVVQLVPGTNSVCGLIPHENETSEVVCAQSSGIHRLELPGMWSSLAVAAFDPFSGFSVCGVQPVDGGPGKLRCIARDDYYEPNLLPDVLASIRHIQPLQDSDSVCIRVADGTWRCPGLARGTRDLTGVEALEVDSHAGCGRLGDGSLRCWGFLAGKAPAGAFSAFDLNYEFGCAVAEGTGVLQCFGDDAPQVPAGMFRAVAVKKAAWQFHAACALDTAGHVTCFGTPAAPASWATQIPNGVFTSIACGNDFCCGVTENAGAECWGNRAFAVPSSLATIRVQSVVPGTGFVCALLESTDLACWGTQLMLPPLGPGFSDLTAGGKNGTACATHLTGGQVCFGGFQVPWVQ